MCLVYSIVYSEFIFCVILLCLVGGILRIFRSFLADISAFLPYAAANFPALFLSVSWHLFVAACLFFLSFLQCFSTAPFVIL